MEDPLADLPHDPRDPANAALRASDRDRDAVHRVLGAAYGDGRLTREELDDRGDRATAARTLGDLSALVVDLVPRTPTWAGASRLPAPRSRAELEAEAARRVRHRQRDAVWGALSASTVCVAIWALTTFGAFFWPVFVILGTGLHAAKQRWRREELVTEEVAKLEKKEQRTAQRRELARRRETGDEE